MGCYARRRHSFLRWSIKFTNNPNNKVLTRSNAEKELVRLNAEKTGNISKIAKGAERISKVAGMGADAGVNAGIAVIGVVAGAGIEAGLLAVGVAAGPAGWIAISAVFAVSVISSYSGAEDYIKNQANSLG